MLIARQETKNPINLFIMLAKTNKLDSRVVVVLVEKTTIVRFWQLLGVVRIKREIKPGFANTFEARKRFEWQPGEDLHHQIIS